MNVRSKAIRTDAADFAAPTPKLLSRKRRSAGRRRAVPAVEFLEARLAPYRGFLQGTSFVDTNLNNQLDPGEPYLPGAEVQLYADDGTTLLGQQLTDANGAYRFDNLPPAYYRLVQVPPAGYRNSGTERLSQLYPSSVLPENILRVRVLDSGGFSATFTDVSPFREINFQVFDLVRTDAPVGQMHVTVSRPGGLEPVAILTFCVDITVMQWPGGAVRPRPLITELSPNGGRIGYLYNRYGTRTDLTADQAVGLQLAIWEFEYDTTFNLASGNFRYLGNDPQILAAANFYRDVSAGKSELALFLQAQVWDHQPFLATGSFNFGNQPLANLVGWKWNDLNSNSRWDRGEPGVPNWTVFLDQNNNARLDPDEPRTLTGANGQYRFDNLVPGSHRVCEEVPFGWMPTYPAMPPPCHTVPLASGQTVAGRFETTEPPNFGNFQGAMIDAWKWNDLNGNGRWEPEQGEFGLSGIIIEAVQQGQVVARAETMTDDPATPDFDETGIYWLFVPPGTTVLREVLPPGWRQTYPGGNGTHTITLAAGENFQAPWGEAVPTNFGNQQLANLVGWKWNDLNSNSRWDRDEPGVPNWTVFLDQNNNARLDPDEPRTLTGANGQYRFDNLVPGSHRVCEEVQLGWMPTYPAMPPPCHTVTLTPGQTVAGRFETAEPPNFGNFQPASLIGWKWHDLNGDRNWDDNEPGLAGWTIELVRGETVLTTQTMADDPNTPENETGKYRFTNLVPGTYTIRELVPGEWLRTYPTGAGTHTVTLAAGQTFSSRRGVAESPNFGNFQLFSLSGQKFEDRNGNGTLDGGEPGLAGWVIFLDTNGNDTLDEGERSTITDANGFYQFTNLGPGTYRVREVRQNGWTQTTTNPANLTGVSGQNIENVRFGNFRLFSLSGQKFEDRNGNGTLDGGEPGLAGWVIFLDTNGNDTLDEGERNTVTDANGFYQFTNLGPGTYRVREVRQNGWTQTTTNPANLTGVSGQNIENVRFGNFRLFSLSGQKFEDRDGNGTLDGGEPGLAGWVIFLDTNGNDTLDEGERSTITDANGFYQFTNLGPGTYRVREVRQNGWTQTTTNPANLTGVSGQNIENVRFGNFRLFSLSGQKFEDRDGNGSRQNGESGLGGWTIFLDTNGNNTLDNGERSTTTDGTGFFRFTDLGPGTYRVREVGQDGWIQTTANPAEVIARSGQNVEGLLFGNFLLTEISGQKFEDRDGAGTLDAGEPGLPNWTIFLDANGNGTLDTGERSTVTDGSGFYRFSNLVPGTYRVREVRQEGWVQTSANPADVLTVSGQNLVAVNFGNFRLTEISGRKFADRNGDGARQESELGLAGWTIFLDANDNGTLDTGERSTVTDDTGSFRFTNLGPGRYQVREVSQAHWLQTTPNPSVIAAVSSQNVTGILFGNAPLVTLIARKFNDLNGNGQLDPGEPGLAGWTFQLDRGADGSIEATTTTDSEGNGRFADLFPGTYRVREVAQDGWVATTALPADVVLPADGAQPAVLFGNFRLVSIAGIKFQDQDDNGVRDANEAGLANWTIFLDANDNGTLDSGERSTTTDDAGSFRFTGLGPGTYRVREVQQPNWRQTTPNPDAIVAVSGLAVEGVLFGNLAFQIAPGIGEQLPLPVFPCAEVPAILADLGGKGQLIASALGQLERQSAFVAGLYCNILNRAPDQQGLTSWVLAIQSGSSHQAVAQTFWQSAEHRGLQVDRFYTVILDRPADAAGRATWVNALQAGLSETDTLLRFLTSAEYQAKHITNPQYVSGLYADVLGRSVDQAGASGWVQALEQGADRAVAAQAFVGANEFYLRVLDEYYAAYLDRAADPAGRLSWLRELRSGRQTLETVAEAILASGEYADHVLRK